MVFMLILVLCGIILRDALEINEKQEKGCKLF